MDKYLPRLIDSVLDVYLRTFGAVSIVGPKWTGKTVTCEQRAKSAFYFTGRPGHPDPLALALTDSSYVFQGEKPRLIDEWQLMPQLWDMIRGDIDSRHGERGLYLLTGSSLLPQKTRTGKTLVHHSGTGRIGSLKMSTMTLYETGDSSGEVSLASLFEGEKVHGSIREIRLADIIHFIIRGGWPGNLDTEDPSIIPRDYISRICDEDLDKLEGVNIDRIKFRRFLYSLARNESTVCSVSTLSRDAGENGSKLDDSTVNSYLNILKMLFLDEAQPAFSPFFRSRTRLKIGEKRHFADPSLAAAIMGANEKNLLSDLQYLGFLFEALAEHDLRIYAQVLGGELFHYQDYDNDEVDAVIQLQDGRFALIEIKLGANGKTIEEAAHSLVKVSGKMERKPDFMAVVSGMASAPYCRKEDGVFVLPLTSLKP